MAKNLWKEKKGTWMEIFFKNGKIRQNKGNNQRKGK